jgi:[ribosomal protein S18]-alanine N-acetyltransferase
MTDQLGSTGGREHAPTGRPLPEGWTVVTLQESDLDDVLAIEGACFSNPWTRDMFLRELANAGVSYGYVLRGLDGRAAAFCTIWVIADEVHINNLAVDPAWRGRGLGQALLEFILRLWSGLGAERATLEVRRSNETAINLYAKLGFTVAGIRREYYTEPVEDALILWRERAGAQPVRPEDE